MKKILLYEMKFLVPNYSCLQNPWLGGYRPRSPFSLPFVLNWVCWTPPKKNSWVRHCWDPHGLKILKWQSDVSWLRKYRKRLSHKLLHKSAIGRYWGADKSLARPGRKQARNRVSDASDFNNIETRAVIKFFFPARQGAEGNSRHSDRKISFFPSWSG